MRRSIVLVLATLFVATALAPAASRAAETYAFTVLDQVDVVTRYGDTINIDLCFPSHDGTTPAPGPFPVIGELSPYVPNGQAGCFMTTGVKTGYVGVHINSPGTSDSAVQGGVWDYGDPSYALRHYDAIEWLAAQPWSTGKFGSIGGSGVGVSQVQTSAYRPPHYTTAIFQVSTGDSYKSLKPGGIRSGTEVLVCAIPGFQVTAQNQQSAPPEKKIENATWRAQHLSTSTPGHCPPVHGSWAHPNRDGYWEDRTANLEKVTMPVWVQGAQDDLFALGSEDDYQLLGSENKMFQFGYTSHAGNKAGFNQTAEALRWFDYWLKGIDTGIDEDLQNRRFRYLRFPYLTEPGSHKSASDYPIPNTQYTDYYLNSGAPNALAAVAVNGSLSTTPPTSAGSADYAYVPTDGKYANPFGAGEAIDQRLETGGRVSFIGDALTGDVEITGSTKMKLFAKTSATDTDWVAKLLDVAPDGSIAHVRTMGYLNSKFRGWEGDYVSSSPTPPGEVVEYHIQFYPTSWLFKAGHRIALSISSSDVGETYPNANPAQISVVFGPDHPTAVTLPVIPQ